MKKRMQTWRVYKDYSETGSWLVGTVEETNEASARCAALSKFGRADDDPESDDAIGPNDQFHVVTLLKARLKQAWAFYEALWPRRTIEQDLLQRAQKAHTVIQQTRHTILSQRFLEHLALAEIAALEHWHHEVYPALLNEFTKGDTK